MNGKTPIIFTAPPFVLRLSKDERSVFQPNRGSRIEDGDSRTTIVHPPSSILELSPVPRRARVRLVFFLDLLGQIVLISDFLYLVQLRFDPVDMFFLVDENMLQKLPRGIVRNFDAGFDAVAQDG